MTVLTQLRKLQTAILLTLAYSQVFGVALTKEELRHRLLKVSKNQAALYLDKVLLLLEEKGFVYTDTEYIYLTKENQNSREQDVKREHAINKLTQAASFLPYVQKIPWITSVYVTGSVAAGFSSPHDDIDFLVITEKNRLWLSRIWLFFLLRGHPLRRKRSQTNHLDGAWCTNMWLEENTTLVRQSERSVYTAYELLQAERIYAKEGYKKTLLEDNCWTHVFLQTVASVKNKNAKKKKKNNFSPAVDLLNVCSYYAQSAYMQLHQTRETTDLHQASFHPRDTRRLIYQKWHKIVLTLGQK
ncbi:MAG: hypothetical protein H6774_02125 [Pseudomonadales bacterium]|nr:hypothetical protein [Candidatus Woesebacteria bacterium]MCB9801864.1 hypothetical protein [Pseudomonadales bacterium]